MTLPSTVLPLKDQGHMGHGDSEPAGPLGLAAGLVLKAPSRVAGPREFARLVPHVVPYVHVTTGTRP